MAKPNYSYEKRQRELAKKQKKADKLARKNAPPVPGQADDSDAQNNAPAQVDPSQPVPEVPKE